MLSLLARGKKGGDGRNRCYSGTRYEGPLQTSKKFLHLIGVKRTRMSGGCNGSYVVQHSSCYGYPENHAHIAHGGYYP